MAALTISLDDGWSFTQVSGQERNKPDNRGTEVGEWLPIKIPTGVHEQLIKSSRIPDPFVGMSMWRSKQVIKFNIWAYSGLNEHVVQWIGEETWAFRTTLAIPAGLHALPYLDLVFDGLDTYATVEIDGKPVLE